MIKSLLSRLSLSSVVKKLVMSISGLFLMVFLVVHLAANFTAVFSAHTYNAVCAFMDTNPFIQIMVPVLALGFVIHIFMAGWITLVNLMARPVGYAGGSRSKASSWAAGNMFVLGLVVLGLLGVHLSHFWAKMQLPHFLGQPSAENPYLLVKTTLESPLWAAVYLVWIAALWFHLSHGFWSAFQSIGANNGKWLPRLRVAALTFATIVCAGFAFVVLWFAFGLAP